MHLNSGDKIVCLKDYTTRNRNLPNEPLFINYIKNKVYTIDSYNYDAFEHYKITGEFVLVHFSVTLLDNWFVTLKECRKNKLKKLNMKKIPVHRFDTFDNYLIMVGIRSLEYTFTNAELFEGVELFRKCYENHTSAYYALLYLHDYLKDPNSVVF